MLRSEPSRDLDAAARLRPAQPELGEGTRVAGAAAACEPIDRRTPMEHVSLGRWRFHSSGVPAVG